MKLHIGGETAKPGWTILNAQAKPGVDIVGDITDLSWFSDGSVEEIYASHVLEHVPQAKVLATLQGICRILASGGRFYCSVPDMEILARLILEPQLATDHKWQVMRMLFGGQVDDYDYHHVGWTHAFLEHFAAQAGFGSMERVTSFGLFDDTSDYQPFGIPISLNVILRK